MPKRKQPKQEGRLAPLYIVTLANGQEYMTTDIEDLQSRFKKGYKIRKTPHFAITRRRLKKN